MKNTTLLLTLISIPALLQTSQQPASNSNAKAAESYAIGQSRKLNAVYPLFVATQSGAKGSHNDEGVPLTSIAIVSPKAQAGNFNQAHVLADTNMSMGICTFLDYHDFAHINQLSQSWHNMMQRCEQADPPLVATDAARVAAYARRLINDAPDMNRLSAIKLTFPRNISVNSELT